MMPTSIFGTKRIGDNSRVQNSNPLTSILVMLMLVPFVIAPGPCNGTGSGDPTDVEYCGVDPSDSTLHWVAYGNESCPAGLDMPVDAQDSDVDGWCAGVLVQTKNGWLTLCVDDAKPGDCDDAEPLSFPGNPEVCGDTLDNNCDGTVDEGCGVPVTDDDGDGSPLGVDCDDSDPNNFPGNPEVCDGQDNDCNGLVDGTDEVDMDTDGVLLCAGDCNDNEPAMFPGNPEVCDGLDNDCNTLVDGTDEVDMDGDSVLLCGGDCNDNDIANFPGNPEVCDLQDNNCDTQIDEGGVCLVVDTGPGNDDDADGYCEGYDDDANPLTPDVCDDGSIPGDCDDLVFAINPGVTEDSISGNWRDGLDNNCNGATDELVCADGQGMKYTISTDTDADGFGDVAGNNDVSWVLAGFSVYGLDDSAEACRESTAQGAIIVTFTGDDGDMDQTQCDANVAALDARWSANGGDLVLQADGDGADVDALNDATTLPQPGFTGMLVLDVVDTDSDGSNDAWCDLVVVWTVGDGVQ